MTYSAKKWFVANRSFWKKIYIHPQENMLIHKVLFHTNMDTHAHTEKFTWLFHIDEVLTNRIQIMKCSPKDLWDTNFF